jgi:hypothetical protein
MITWNTQHFVEEKTEIVQHVLKNSAKCICWLGGAVGWGTAL